MSVNRALRTNSTNDWRLSSTRQRVNLTYLEEMSGGDTEFVAEVIQMFLEAAPDTTKQILNYLKNENYTLLKSAAHKLKPTVQMLGDTELHDLIVKVEEICLSEKTETTAEKEQITMLTTTLVKETQQLIKALEIELVRLKKD